jgi:RHS repeat-associated protein
LKKTYIYANSQILAQHDGAPGTSNKYFYLHDRLGSVREIISQSGSVVNYYTYDPFGVTRESGGSLTNYFMFTGQYYDSQIDWYYLRERMYDPVLMRLTGRDSFSGDFTEPLTLHKYLYCGNEPINSIDPTGLWQSGRRNYHEGDNDWYGHSDMGYGRGDFDYTELDYMTWSAPWNILTGTRLHFMGLGSAQMYVYFAIMAGDSRAFGWAGHMGQDSFSRYGKGYSPLGHLIADDIPDNPYVYDAEGNRRLSSEYIEADRWTKQMEEIWYLFQDPYEWIGASGDDASDF